MRAGETDVDSSEIAQASFDRTSGITSQCLYPSYPPRICSLSHQSIAPGVSLWPRRRRHYDLQPPCCWGRGFVDKGGGESTLFSENDAPGIRYLPSLSMFAQVELRLERKARIPVSQENKIRSMLRPELGCQFLYCARKGLCRLVTDLPRRAI